MPEAKTRYSLDMNELKRSARSLKRSTSERASILGAFLAAMWGLEIVDWLLPGQPLDIWGIRPRDTDALGGILFAPFLHLNFSHLIANSIPFAVLGWLVMFRSTNDFFRVFVVAMLVAGVGTWLFGAPGTIHIGASGIVFGFIGFLLSRGIFEKSVLWLLIGLVVTLLYGGTLWSLVSIAKGISWSGHFFGFAGGILAAWRMSRRW
jgi:membrane associated rhomboid family serine protease